MLNSCYFCKKRLSENPPTILSSSMSGAKIKTKICEACFNKIGFENIVYLIDNKLSELDKIKVNSNSLLIKSNKK